MDERYEDGYDPKYGYNRNAFAYKTASTGLLSRVVKLVSTPIALASEAVAHNKQKDAPSSESLEKSSTFVEVSPDQADALIKRGDAVPADGEQPTHEIVDPDERDDDQADWALDEAASEIDEAGSLQAVETSQLSVADVMAGIKPPKYTPMQSGQGKNTLPFPVVLPQRRPSTKTRGFVRAYAPVLADMGIDQASFLGFLNGLHKAAQAYPIFDIIQIGTALAGLYPDPIIGLSMQAAQIIAAAAAEMQERWTTNKFLDAANQEIFIPRGLYCMIVTYKPGGAEEVGAPITKKTVDLAAPAVAKYGDTLVGDSSAEATAEDRSKMDEMKEKMRTRLHIASGETEGEAEMPVTYAPLIYPALERTGARIALGEGEVAKKRMDRRTAEFVGDYFDRRARMIEATNNPNGSLTTLSGGKPAFESRMGDPNDGRNRHFITLLSGGKIQAEPLGGKRRWEKAKRKENERF